MAKTVKIFKKALGTFFLHLQALTNCKVSEKSNERFPRKSIAHARTYGRESLGLQRLRRETKNTYFQVFQGFPALKETHPHIQPNGQNGENYQKKRLEHFSRTYKP